MIRNYFTVALRNILKHKFFSLINILGMTIGLTACLLIILYISSELSYDKFHADADRIYQVGLHGKIGDQDLHVANTCPPLAAAMVADIPEVQDATRISSLFSPSVRYGDKAFTEERTFYVDSNFFDFFSFRLIEGDARTALKEPNSVLLTPEIAKKYFGDESPMGKLMVIGDENRSFKVTGVVAEAPDNSHFKYNILVSASSSENLRNTIWLNNFLYTYYKLRPNTSSARVDEKFSAITEKYVGPEVERFMGMSLKEMKAKGGAYGYYSTGLTDIHLHSTSQGDIEPGGNMMYVYFFGAVGIFIMVIACVNFMNMSTARSAGRAKEVGLRKTLGSLRQQMIGQFLAESMLYTTLALVLSLLACYLLLPQFNILAGKELNMTLFSSPLFVALLIGMVLFVGLLAGSYPAFYLTSFNAVEVLKGKVRAGMKSKGVRSTLVVLQFMLSIFLIIFTLVVYDQISFMQEKNLGLDKNNVLVVSSTNRLGTNAEAFRNALKDQPGISKISYSNNTFPGVNNTTVFRAGGSDQDHIMGLYFADYDHLDVMKIELKEGRYFSKDFPSDSTGIILNEAAVREFGYEKPVGEEILFNGNNRSERLKVIGVVKNFNFESFKDEVRPLAIRFAPTSSNAMMRYEGSPKQIIESVEKLWKQYAANEPFEYAFLDQEFDELFRAEQRMGTVFSVFSGLAIFIASLGLFALAAFTAEQRTKEIGIRKAMGAEVWSLTFLLSKEFTRLVLIAFVPAAAAGWYISNQWLQGFAYRVDVSPLTIILSGVSAMVIALLTVSYQSVKAAMVNPVKSLRYE